MPERLTRLKDMPEWAEQWYAGPAGKARGDVPVEHALRVAENAVNTWLRHWRKATPRTVELAEPPSFYVLSWISVIRILRTCAEPDRVTVNEWMGWDE